MLKANKQLEILEILPQDLRQTENDAVRRDILNPRKYFRPRRRVLIASPMLMGIDQPSLSSDLLQELKDQDVFIKAIHDQGIIIGYIAHRLPLTFFRKLPNGQPRVKSAQPLALGLPVFDGAWSVYETHFTLTLRFNTSGFITWAIRTDDECQAMLKALKQLTFNPPRSVYYCGEQCVRAEEIANFFRVPLLRGELTQDGRWSFDLLNQTTKSPIFGTSVDFSSRVKARLANSIPLLRSPVGMSVIVFVLVMTLTFWVQTSIPPTVRLLASSGAAPSPSEVGYFSIVDRISQEISRLGFTQATQIRMRLEAPGSDMTVGAITVEWQLAAVPLQSGAVNKNRQLLAQKLHESIAQMPSITSVNIDSSARRIAVQSKIVGSNQKPIPEAFGQWIGRIKKNHAVQIFLENDVGRRYVLRAPEQPVGNLISFAHELLQYQSVRELILSVTTPGLAGMTITLESSR